MPIAKFQMPDGRIGRFEVPEGTTPEQAQSMISQYIGGQQKAPSGQQEGIGRTAFDQGMQGLTFGFADEVSDALGAVGAGALSEDLTIPEAWKQARELTKERQKRQFEQNPGVSIASNIAGGLLTGGAGATTKAGAAIRDFVGTGNLAARMAKTGIASAPAAALYGAGTAEDGDRLGGAARGGAFGLALGAAGPLAGAGLSKLNTKKIIPNSDQVREAGSRAFQAAEKHGGALDAKVANGFYNKVLGIRPQTLEGQVFAGESAVSKLYEKIPSLMNRPMTLRAAQEVDEALGDLAYASMDTFGKISKDGQKFLNMQRALRDTIENVDESMVIGGKAGFDALKDARKYWSTSLKMRDIERILQRAEGKEQPVTVIKNGFNNLLNRGDKLKGYSPAEVKAIRKAAKTGIVTDIVKLAGSGLVPILSGVGGGAVGGIPGGVASAMLGSAIQQVAKKTGTVIQTGKANKALEEVARRSGLVSETQRIDFKKLLKLKPKEAMAILALSPKDAPK